MTYRHIAVFTLLMGCSLPMVACTQGSSDGAGQASGGRNDASVPPIYVAQTEVLLLDGKPLVEKNYREALSACLNAKFPTTPLSDSDVGKLGRTYDQLWFDNTRTADQGDTWGVEMVGSDVGTCHFRVTHTSKMYVSTRTGNRWIDLIARTSTSEPARGEFIPGGPGAWDDDDQLDPGAAELGFQRLGYANDAGQRCLRWRDLPGTESCTWSEGHRWGFPRGAGGGQATTYDPGVIVLWVHPADGTGGELTTQKMTVGGQPFDDALFQPPSGATVKAGEP